MLKLLKENWKKVAAVIAVIAIVVTVWQIIEVRKTWIELEVVSVETVDGNPGLVEKTYVSETGEEIVRILENTGEVWDRGYKFKVSPETYNEMLSEGRDPLGLTEGAGVN